MDDELMKYRDSWAIARVDANSSPVLVYILDFDFKGPDSLGDTISSGSVRATDGRCEYIFDVGEVELIENQGYVPILARLYCGFRDYSETPPIGEYTG